MLGLDTTSGSAVIKDEFTFDLQAGASVGEAVLLFSELTTDRINEMRTRFAGSQADRNTTAPSNNDGFRLDMRVGRVSSVENVEDSEKLYLCKVDVGEETGPRQVVAGSN